MFTLRSPHGSRYLARELSAVAVSLLVVALIGTSGVATAASNTDPGASAAGAQSPQCSSSLLRETVTTNQPSYGPGTIVRMTWSIRNVSAATCNLGIGATSPSFSVTNSRGVEVWNNCYANDRPGACPMYLLLLSLKPGATYSKSFAWDQRSGPTPTRVPVGVYQMSVRFGAIAAIHSVKFNLLSSSPPGTVTVTGAQSGRTVTVRLGGRLVVRLSGPSSYTWTEPVSSNPAVLQRTAGSSGSAITAIFVARSKGRARVTAVDNPNCYPGCLPPSRLFTVTVSVVG